MSVESLAAGVKEQNAREEKQKAFFVKCLNRGEFERARKYAERKRFERSKVCSASQDFFKCLVRAGRKTDYLLMISAFEGYYFECWLDDSNIKPQIYKSMRRY